jgi:hypothetical protein
MGKEFTRMIRTQKKHMRNFFKEHFGHSNMFRFTFGNELKINRLQYKKALKSANSHQLNLLNGLRAAIATEHIAKVQVKENTVFTFENYEPLYNNEGLEIGTKLTGRYTTDIGKSTGTTTPPTNPASAFGHVPYYGIAISINSTMDNPYTTGNIMQKMIGKDDATSTNVYTGRSVSSTFMHEILDEFLNYFINKTVTDKTPKINAVKFQNDALQNLGLPKRDGVDHQ